MSNSVSDSKKSKTMISIVKTIINAINILALQLINLSFCSTSRAVLVSMFMAILIESISNRNMKSTSYSPKNVNK